MRLLIFPLGADPVIGFVLAEALALDEVIGGEFFEVDRGVCISRISPN